MGRYIEVTHEFKKPFSHIVKEVIRISDIIIEVLDARYIEETRNKEIEEHIKSLGKKIIFAINKTDMADLKKLKESGKLKELMPYTMISVKSKKGRMKLIERIKIEVKKLKNEHYQRKHIGIIGYPNTGKSSLINFLAGKRKAKTSKEAGFTKGMQKIKLAENIFLIDTPGNFPEREYKVTKESLAKQAEIGVKTFSQMKDPELAVLHLITKYPEEIESFYGINKKDPEEFIEELGRKKHFLEKGNKVNIDRTCRLILKDWQEGRIKN